MPIHYETDILTSDARAPAEVEYDWGLPPIADVLTSHSLDVVHDSLAFDTLNTDAIGSDEYPSYPHAEVPELTQPVLAALLDLLRQNQNTSEIDDRHPIGENVEKKSPPLNLLTESNIHALDQEIMHCMLRHLETFSYLFSGVEQQATQAEKKKSYRALLIELSQYERLIKKTDVWICNASLQASSPTNQARIALTHWILSQINHYKMQIELKLNYLPKRTAWTIPPLTPAPKFTATQVSESSVSSSRPMGLLLSL